MFELTTEHAFSAAHAIIINGVMEPLHGHDWRVTVTVSGQSLDHDGLLVDFHAVHHDLVATTKPFQNTNLNEVEPFKPVGRGGLNPTAENVARHIATQMGQLLETRYGREPMTSGNASGRRPSVRIASVRVTEAVGCAATYFPPVAPD